MSVMGVMKKQSIRGNSDKQIQDIFGSNPTRVSLLKPVWEHISERMPSQNSTVLGTRSKVLPYLRDSVELFCRHLKRHNNSVIVLEERRTFRGDK